MSNRDGECMFDLIILAVLILMTLRGGSKGMVSQIVSVGSYFVCWIVASRFAFIVAPSIPAQEPWDRVGAMLLLFVGTMIAIRFLHGRFEKSLEKYHLKEFNRQMGALLGLLKGVLICMVITFFAVMLTEKSRQSVFESRSGKYIALLITKTGAFIPDDTCKLLKAQIDLFDAEVNGTAPKSTETTSNTAATPTSAIGLFARGAALVDEAQQLRDELTQKSNNAASLLDAIGKWWSGSSTPTETVPPLSKAEPEKKIESSSQSEPSTLAKQPISLQPPPIMESAKLTMPSPIDEQAAILPKPPALTSEEQAIRNLASFGQTLQPTSSPETQSTVPFSSSHNRFLFRLASERSPDRLLKAAKEAPSPTAASLFSPQRRQSTLNWDPKIWAQSLER